MEAPIKQSAAEIPFWIIIAATFAALLLLIIIIIVLYKVRNMIQNITQDDV